MKLITNFGEFKPFYFWQKLPFTQWTDTESQFTDEDGKVFSCMEQYMMYRKAQLFDDLQVSDKIMETKSPRIQKEFGRLVQDFDPTVWDKWKMAIVIHGNMLKFEQNPEWAKELKDVVLNCQYFVESCPNDKVWGIGINTAQAQSGVEWQGENLLGIALTNVAMELIRKDQLLYQEDIQSIASDGIDAINNKLASMEINPAQPNVVNLIENDLYDIMVEYLEEKFGIGQYRNCI